MTNVLRAAGSHDLPAIYEMAKNTGGGFTNLPPDQGKLSEKLAASSEAFARADDADDNVADDKFFFVLEDQVAAKALGTCQIFSKIGSRWPFYSYRVDAFEQYSEALDRTVRSELLTLCTDHGGCSEVGGLYLNASERSSGMGALLARGRYLFIGMHRDRFADRTIAELRGVVDEAGDSPFWDGVGRRFFGMSFREADEFNAVNGNQFIADLMPKTAIYKSMLAASAINVLGLPHVSGRPAMRMLEREGFTHDKYVDIFDGGPTMSIATSEIATIRNSHEDTVIGIGTPDGSSAQHIVAAGRLANFRACFAQVSAAEDGIVLDSVAAAALGVSVGDSVTHVAR